MKADMFQKWHTAHIDKGPGILDSFKVLANIRSQETLQEWGAKLVRQHRPADLLELPDFMKPRTPPPRQAVATSQPQTSGTTHSTQPAAPNASPESAAKKLICAHCNAKISFAEGKFCWGNERRFGGLQYCREHQALFK